MFRRETKKGVSLIAVLMFMLIATIAATATYKWITSESHSSTSRMLQREAYQSSIAGIENARSWMTYNANDFGALVTQYFQSEKKSILMTPVLQSSLNSKGQNYNVWLTGVEVNSNGLYKVQLLSVGEARGGTKHSEVAIFNVTGLYQVNVPKKKATYSGTIDFDYNYFGGGTKNAGDFHTKSMLINGNQTKDGNPAYVEKNLVVTGNFKVSGSQIVVGENACIGGYFDANNGVAGGNFYIEGNAKNFIMVSKTYNGTTYNGVSGDVYVGGDIESANGNQELGGSLYLGGTWHTNLSGYQAGVKKNLCFGPHAYLDLPSLSKVFYADSDVWVANAKAIKNEKSNYDKIHLGRGTGSDIYSPYVYSTSDYTKEGSQGGKYRNYKIAQKCVSGYGGLSCSDWKHYPSEKLGGDYQTDRFYLDSTIKMEYRKDGGEYANYMWDDGLVHADYGGTTTYNPTYTWTTCTSEAGTSDYAGIIYFPTCTLHSWFKSSGTRHNQAIGTDPNIECGQTVKSNCSSMWVDGTGCDGTSHYVRDPIITGIGSFEGFADSGCAKNIKTFNSSIVSSLNSCSSTATEQQLYNGYLVVKVTDAGKTDFSTALDGKFIIIFSNKPSMQQMPATTKGSYVFVYFKEGAGEILMGDTATHNYFLYSPKNIDKIQKDWTGTVYTAVGTPGSSPSCATVSDLIGVKNIESDSNMLKSLAGSAILCDNVSSASCGGVVVASSSSGAGGGSSSSADLALSGVDVYHISTAPQLGITLESQYESRTNNPPANNTVNLSPSILVLPRVVYLPRDPIGKLEDYYNVINLNGATEVKTPSKVSCTPSGISSTGELYDGSHLLTEGIYTCTYASGNEVYGDVPFFLVVTGTTGSAPTVRFTTDNAEMTSGGTVPIYLNVPQSSHGSISVDVMVSSLPDSKWSITPKSGVTQRIGTSGNVIYSVQATPSNVANTQVNILDVVTESGAASGTVTLQLIPPCDGCNIGTPNIENVFLVGSSIIQRSGIKEYCQNYPDNCTSENNYVAIGNRPDCGPALFSGEWVRADGTNCSVNGSGNANNEWKCATNTSIRLVPNNLPNGNLCELIIPSEDNSISAPEDDQTYTLYASLKRVPYTLTVNREGAGNSATVVKVFTSLTNTFETSPTYTCSDNQCVYNVYAGDRVKLEYSLSGTDKFSYWRSSSPNSPTTEPVKAGDFTLQPITANNTVLAKFNDKDKHCFYDDFMGLQAFCNDKECIADCNTSTCAANVNATANWQLSFPNGKKNSMTSNVPPIIENGVVYSDNDKNSNNQNGGQTLVMNNRQAGRNGVMTALIQTKNFKQGGTNNDGLNSGFVLRSDASGSSYLILNIFGYGNKDNASSGTLYARLCSVSGQGTNNSTKGCVEKALSNQQLTISPTTMIKVQMTLGESSLLVKGEVNGREGTTSFDLSGNFALNGMNNEYVGMKVSDSYFKLYDIGWESSSFPNEGCFEVPTVSCSFKANYIGGLVPMDSNVTPWAAASSWFTANGCVLDYSYSGSDNSTSSTPSARGSYEVVSSSPAGTYHFSESGTHGLTGPDTYNDAKISVRCDNTTTSLNGKSTSCGVFQVGGVDNCAANYEILASTSTSISATAGVDQEIATPNATNGVNLRGSSLSFAIQDLGDDQTITVYLKDKHGTFSLPSHISGSGVASLDVTGLSNIEGFDPQSVIAIVMNGTANFTVTSIQASCPYVFSIESCPVSYNGTSWVINATFNNVSGALANGCNVSADNGIIGLTNVSCTNSGFSIPDDQFYERLNSGTGTKTKFTFTVSAKNLDGVDVPSCVSEVEYEQNAITCTVADIVQGQALPSVNFSISNCPDGGCPYTVKFGSDKSGTGTYKSGTASWTAPDVSTTSMTSGTYTIESMGKTQTCSFEVNAKQEAEATCTVTDGVVSGTITSANYGNPISISVAVSDYMGNILGITQVEPNTTYSNYSYNLTDKNLTPGKAYVVTLAFNGETENCGSYTPPLAALSLSGCPTSLSAASTTFTPVVAGCNGTPACHWSIDNSATVPDAYNGAVTISNATEGKTYRLTLTRGTSSTETNYATTYCDITYPTSTPSFSVQCNSGTGNTITVDDVPENSTVEVTPYNVEGCGSADCSYDITQNGTSVYSGVQTGYTGGKVEFTGTSGNNVPYVLTINGPTGTTPQTCTFNVTYTSGGSGDVCGCASTCGTDCENMRLTTYSNNQNGEGMYCIFVDDGNIKIRKGTGTYCTAKINGTTFTNQISETNLNSIASANSDGGYYIYIGNGPGAVNNTDYCDFMLGSHTSQINPCAPDVKPVLESCPVSATEIAPNAPVVITPSTTTCNTKKGCTYTIGGDYSTSGTFRSGTIQFTDNGANDGDEKAYTLTLSVDGKGSSEPCAIGIKYSSNANVKITDVDQPHDVKCGKSIEISVPAAQWNRTKLKCSGYFDKTVGGTFVDHNTGDVVVDACANYGNGSPFTCTKTFTTECSTNTLSCRVIRQ